MQRAAISRPAPVPAASLVPGAAGAPEYYSIGQAAQLLGVSRVSVWRWIRDGRLPALRLGQRTTRIRHADVDRLLHAAGANIPEGVTVPRRAAAVESPDDAAPHTDWRAMAAGKDAPAHVVQFYEADTVLLDALTAYSGAALRAGDAAITIATPAHRAELEERLRAEGLAVDGARAAGQYIALDAADTLARLLVDGAVDPARFAEVVGGLVASAGVGRPRVWAFGEMVALLVAAGTPAAAIGLEALWNALQQAHAFMLFCAYPIACLDGVERASLLGDVCAAHARVIPAESYTALPTTDDRLRAIATLQQQARSLGAALAAAEAARSTAEEALAAEAVARATAEEALRVRDEFLSIAAHELKTPITSLSGQAQLLRRRVRRDGAVAPDQLAPALEMITGQAERLSRLIGHLLDIARLEGGKLTLECQATELSGLVAQVVAGARLWSERHPIGVVTPPALMAWVDPLRLEQVLTNLLANAVTYSPDGGPVEVVLARVDAATAALAVRDHGLGIPVEKRAHLFERFYRAHAHGHRGGLGLGLYISRQIVELHGGAIRAEFPRDGGTRFVVTLPLQRDEAATSPLAAACRAPR